MDWEGQPSWRSRFLGCNLTWLFPQFNKSWTHPGRGTGCVHVSVFKIDRSNFMLFVDWCVVLSALFVEKTALFRKWVLGQTCQSTLICVNFCILFYFTGLYIWLYICHYSRYFDDNSFVVSSEICNCRNLNAPSFYFFFPRLVGVYIKFYQMYRSLWVSSV